MFGQGSTCVSLPPLSARGPSGGQLPPLSLGATSTGGTGGVIRELGSRRAKAVKSAFKRFDPRGKGIVPLADVLQAIGEATGLSSTKHRELSTQLTRISTPSGKTGAQALSFVSFAAYYQTVSASIDRDSDFEQLLSMQWGCLHVSDILMAMQRHFVLIGMERTFGAASASSGGGNGGTGSAPGGFLDMSKFRESLINSGFSARSEDMERAFDAFAKPTDESASFSKTLGLFVADLREQLLAPRPETPLPVVSSRDLAFAAGSDFGMQAPNQFAIGAGNEVPDPMTAPPEPGGVGLPPSTGLGAAAEGLAPSMGLGAPAVGLGGPQTSAIAAASMTNAVQPASAAPMPVPASSSQTGVNNSSSLGVPSLGVGAPGAALVAPPSPGGPVPTDADLDEAIAHMHGQLAKLKPQANGGQGADGPTSEADMDAALSRMEAHLTTVKAHKAAKAAQQQAPLPAPPPVDMPHWEHHKYGHHKITEPAWKADAQTVDMYGNKHNSAEYGFTTSGAGAHGHHLAHYHLNDYHGLAHHSFNKEEYHRQAHGDKTHHGHWVPHLHGIGTSSHHGEHSYKAGEYQNEAHGKPGHHSHYVPHLHGIGNIGN